MNPLKAERAKPSLSSDYNLLFKNKIGESSLDIHLLCPYNGFLLAVNLDALFDKFLISFEDDGKIIISPGLPQQDLEVAGITADMKLRFVQPKHLPFLRWQRARMAAVQRTLWREK